LAGGIPELVPATDTRVPAQSADVPLRLEALEIVTGRRRYPADVRLPGMLRGHVLHGPTLNASLVSLDKRGARAMPGVVEIVRDGDFIGVVAERDEQALAAAEAMPVSTADRERIAHGNAERLFGL